MAASYKPVALYGLEVQANDEPVHIFEGTEFPATIRLTMAALDPTSPAEDGVDANTPVRATLKMIRIREDPEDDEFDEDDEDSDDEKLGMEDLLDDSDDDDDDDEEVNGGPSDPAKSPKARKKAALAKLRKALAEGAEDDMELDEPKADKKGKAKAAADEDEEDDDDDDEDDDEDDEDDDEDFDAEEFVLCTLDPLKNYQQPLDIVVNEHETVLFQVIGTHNIHLTGNVLLPEDDEDLLPRYPGLDEDEDDELDYDSDEDELDLLEGASDEESDELDDLDDPRIAEVDSDEEEAEVPKLVTSTKGKNKRAAEDDSELEPAATNGTSEEPQLSKNQLKKLRKKQRDNEGNAVDVTAAATTNGVKASAAKETPESKEKKSVAFAKNLVQGPTNGTSTEAAAAAAKPAGPKVVQGVTIDDKKIGTGPAAKKNDRVSMRYIGKLDSNKKVFDSNKKGAPFTFKLGSGQVIKGWDIGVAGMQVGGERRITIPAHLAYGSAGAPPDIPKNATLVFDLKVLEIKK